eukprot:9074235-Karenia_brevis.AAC.1
MDTSSSNRTSSSINAATFAWSSFAKSSLVWNSVSKSNMACKVVAVTSVPSISTFAAAIPVGAAALQFFLWTRHHRKTLSRRKLFPVPADAWTIRRKYLPAEML